MVHVPVQNNLTIVKTGDYTLLKKFYSTKYLTLYMEIAHIALLTWSIDKNYIIYKTNLSWFYKNYDAFEILKRLR